MVSVIMPAREEPWLNPTIRDVLAKAVGDVEVIVACDGWVPPGEPFNDSRVRYLHFRKPVGLRPAINDAMASARGEFVFKLDAHCSVSEGWDEVLVRVCGDYEIIVPAKYSLDVELWTHYNEPWHYYYLTFPWDNRLNHVGLHDKNCPSAVNKRHKDVLVDDILSYQGSAWFMRKRHWDRIGPMNWEMYYTAQEPQELGLATWLLGGRVRIHKGVWYAHMWKGRGRKRGFPTIKPRWVRALRASAEYWIVQPGMPALVERFWEVLKDCEYGPWPIDWQDPKYRAASDAFRREHGE
jgi:glycosyltransferase involved in cell wall biosynthesis